MSSQLVDIDSDGHNDILVGSFSGVPQLIKGSAEGFAEPRPITGADGQTVLIANFWNYETTKWDTTDRAGSEGHCTSVAAVDWDADGDLDLLLGDYYGGRLYLCENQGDARTPKFAGSNQPVQAAGQPLVVPQGLAAPRIVDWDGDGRFDILCGGSHGGVYLYKNEGTKTAPRFAAATTLIPVLDDPSNSYITRVPTRNGQPTFPGSSYHIEPVDYDADGDLDLLVGARSSWLKASPKVLTDKEREELAKINQRFNEVYAQMRQFTSEAKTDEARQALAQNEAYQKLVREFQTLLNRQQEFDTDPSETGDFVWLFRRVAK
ncbi:MAG: VCBS repeat-containing protein [Pirellulaceae bacterium]|nr:VCBS repeat-containing protein [Pirellulaceae bacterium]